ncbi:MAG: methylmalonyl-CoA mutase [Deltaproteobacteria bacterium]|nr:methylmalonyl-CoA mutase [Deltaproteobacteria bacterium]
MGVATYIKDEKDAIKEVILQSGIKVKPVYKPEDLERIGFDYEKDLGDPGEYPFTRGIHPLGYRSRNWTVRQYSGFGTPKETNERFRLLISHGQTGLNVAFDLPTQMGYDSDDPMSEGEVGRVGMAVDSLKDFEIAFQDIQLDKIGSSLTINAIATVMLAMYQSVAEKFGYRKEDISATPQNDILKEMIGRGAWIYPVEPAVRLVGDSIEYAMKALPKCNPVSISGYHIRESGGTPAQEIAYALMIAFAYIDNVIARGYKAEEFVSRFSFNLNIYGNLWENVAKFRAGRKLWARLLRERYGVRDKKSLFLRGMFGGGGSGLTKQQPENNIMRGAYYALTAALAGGQTTGLCSFDEAYTIPTERAALLSLRTFQVLMDEIGLRDTVDPLAGSYFMETLTKEMEEKILEEMEKIEKIGGMIEAVSSGFVQSEVAKQAYEFEKKLQKGEVIKVGVNKYTEGTDMEVELHEHNEDWVRRQIDGLKKLRKDRDNSAVANSLKALEDSAKGQQNVMPYLVDCCKAYATVGEMSNVFREAFGEHIERLIF